MGDDPNFLDDYFPPVRRIIYGEQHKRGFSEQYNSRHARALQELGIPAALAGPFPGSVCIFGVDGNNCWHVFNQPDDEFVAYVVEPNGNPEYDERGMGDGWIICDWKTLAPKRYVPANTYARLQRMWPNIGPYFVPEVIPPLSGITGYDPQGYLDGSGAAGGEQTQQSLLGFFDWYSGSPTGSPLNTGAHTWGFSYSYDPQAQDHNGTGLKTASYSAHTESTGEVIDSFGCSVSGFYWAQLLDYSGSQEGQATATTSHMTEGSEGSYSMLFARQPDLVLLDAGQAVSGKGTEGALPSAGTYYTHADTSFNPNNFFSTSSLNGRARWQAGTIHNIEENGRYPEWADPVTDPDRPKKARGYPFDTTKGGEHQAVAVSIVTFDVSVTQEGAMGTTWNIRSAYNSNGAAGAGGIVHINTDDGETRAPGTMPVSQIFSNTRIIYSLQLGSKEKSYHVCRVVHAKDQNGNDLKPDYEHFIELDGKRYKGTGQLVLFDKQRKGSAA